MDIKELEKKWSEHLINSFFTRRFWTMTAIHHKFQTNINITLTHEQMDLIKNYPKFSDYKMTLFGFLLAYFPKIHTALEATDELDLSRRLKIYKLLLANKIIRRRSSLFNKTDKKLIDSARKESHAEFVSHALVREQRAKHNAGTTVK